MMIKRSFFCALIVAGLGVTSQRAHAAVYELRAASTSITMTDGTVVPMWGFGFASDATVSVPGPVLEIAPGDTTLTIHLTNELPVPVSIVIPGIPAALTPVWDDGTTGARTNLQQRVVSFTHVAQPGETVVYEWTNVQPGTYLYQSGAHPAVQVPMGLYGAVKHDDATAQQVHGVGYDRDLVLVYSEIDPSLNAAVAGGTYGTPSYPTTVDYRPRYFLVNGQEATTPPELAQGVNDRLMLRVVNAGLRTAVPTLTAGSMRLIAEDGHAAPFARESYAMLLPAGKTRDALLVLTDAITAVLFDRRGAARLARIRAAPTDGAPVAAADVYDATEDTLLDTAGAGLPSVLANDTGVGLTAVLDSATSAGSLDLSPDGSFTYAPAPDWNGVDTFRYHATDGTLSSNVVTVSIAVAPVNDAPVAVADSYAAEEGTPLVIAAPGLLANDSDVDLDPLSAQVVAGPSGGALLANADGSFQYSAGPGTTSDSFTYQATDGAELSAIATVTITVTAPVNEAPIANDDTASTLRNTDVVVDVAANDVDPDGGIDPASVTVTSQPTRGGAAVALGDGTVRYTPRHNFKGTDTFTYVVRDLEGAESAPATVRVNVVKP